MRNFLIESVLAVLRARADDGLPAATIPSVSTATPLTAPAVPTLSSPVSVSGTPAAYVPPSAVPAQPNHAPAVRLGWRLLSRLREERAVFETPTGLAILDIGAAHQRVLYESILAQFTAQTPISQPMLVPLSIELEPLPAAVLKERLPLLASAGFDFEEYGRNFWRIQALPAWLEPEDALAFVRDLLAEMARREGDFGRPSLAYDALAKIAVIKARRKGDSLSDGELMELVQALFRTVQPGSCPRGRRTYVEWTDADLTRRFG